MAGKRYVTAMAAMFGLVVLGAAAATADETDTATVTVDVLEILAVEVDDCGLFLEYDGDGGYEPDSRTESLTMIHNYKEIVTVEVTHVAQVAGPNNGITLALHVLNENVDAELVLVDEGEELEEETELFTRALPGGANAFDATWSADADCIEATPGGTYIWDVTFTIQ